MPVFADQLRRPKLSILLVSPGAFLRDASHLTR